MELEILKLLDKYAHGEFVFARNQRLSEVCTAPDKAGVYFILKVFDGAKMLVYIGSSGTINQNGEF